ncbi:MAG: cytochrome c [Pseudomonadota bacterium]
MLNSLTPATTGLRIGGAVVLLLLTIGVPPAVANATELSAQREAELIHLLRQDCGSCHGMTLKGGLGPSLLPERIGALPPEFLINTVLEGRKGTAMPPWKNMLSREEVSWMVEQLQKGVPHVQ